MALKTDPPLEVCLTAFASHAIAFLNESLMHLIPLPQMLIKTVRSAVRILANFESVFLQNFPLQSLVLSLQCMYLAL